jgi:alginate O-acetyltransferase complex protein AlgJ
MSSEAGGIEVVEVRQSEEIGAWGMGHLHALPYEGALMIRGWAIGRESAAAAVKVSGDGFSFAAEAPIRLSRPDVTLAVGDDHPGADTPGFVLELTASGSGSAAFQVGIEFADGSTAALGTFAVEVAGGSAAGSDQLEWRREEIPTERQKVVVGKDGWLFLRRDTNDVIGQHTGRVKLGDEELGRWRRILEARVRAARELKARWHCLVVPDKEAVYAEHLPEEIVPAPQRTVHQFLQLAEEVGAPVVYALDALVAEKGLGNLYMKTDTHWNQRGAGVVYRLICRILAEEGVPVEVLDDEAVRWWAETVQGDLGAKLYPEAVSSELVRASLKNPQGRLVFDNKVPNHGRVVISEQDRPDLPSCVVFGESFARGLLVFLQASFRRLTFVHTSMFVREIVEREQPDVVLSVPVERFLLRVPDDSDAFAHLRRAALDKGGDLPWPADRLRV